MHLPAFERYIGIDSTGSEMPRRALKGPRIYLATLAHEPIEVSPPPSAYKYWTRKAVAEWVLERLRKPIPTLVGIDHGFSFPMAYFDEHALGRNWDQFLDNFPSPLSTSGYSARTESAGNGCLETTSVGAAGSRWRRLTEVRAEAKSVFRFTVKGPIAKRTRAGLPSLQLLRRETAGKVHFWPFSGWTIPPGHSAVVEAYPPILPHNISATGPRVHQPDAYSIAAWMRFADAEGLLPRLFQPKLSAQERSHALLEGWILGVV